VTEEVIHKEIDEFSEKAIQEAMKILEEPQYTEEELNLLSKFGFPEIEKVKTFETEKKRKLKGIADFAEYYMQTYPFFKFITVEKLDDICKKYGLIYAQTNFFMGKIPKKNLLEMKNAQKIKEEDVSSATRASSATNGIINYPTNMLNYIERKVTEIRSPELLAKLVSKEPKLGAVLSMMSGDKPKSFPYAIESVYGKELFNLGGDALAEFEKGFNSLQFYIAANPDYFDTSKLEKMSEFRYEIKDPILFRYVKGGVLVITKWGAEANDSELIIGDLN